MHDKCDWFDLLPLILQIEQKGGQSNQLYLSCINYCLNTLNFTECQLSLYSCTEHLCCAFSLFYVDACAIQYNFVVSMHCRPLAIRPAPILQAKFLGYANFAGKIFRIIGL